MKTRRRISTRVEGTDTTIDWLLAGDPSIRWQTLRDVVRSPARLVDRERNKVARDGWGARLLAKQSASGRWAGGKSPDVGLYSPKWTSTTYTLLLLRDFGLSPTNAQARKGCRLLLDHGLREDGGFDFGKWARWAGRGETCVTGMVLSIVSYFECRDDRLDVAADNLLREQMPDGGWNCRRSSGATHSSVNTTISALEGLHHYERHRAGQAKAVRAAQKRGREFLLQHRLFRSHRTGKIIKPTFTKFAFPPRWHYDVLRALDYFRAVDAPRDARLEDAIALVHDHRLPDGRWALENVYAGKTFFTLESLGAPSRWNTLRALRVLKWWGKK
jgi:hypothetical protein